MIEKRIHQVWLGKDPDKRTLDWMESFRRFHSTDWTFRLWREDNLHELGLEPWQWEHHTYAGSSNLIRLHAIYQEGGIFADADVECLKPLDPLLRYDAFYALQPDEPQIACNAFFGAHAGHPWIKWQLDNIGDIRVKDAAWACWLMNDTPKEGVAQISSAWCFPFGHHTPAELRKPESDSLVQHHWIGSWVEKNERTSGNDV